MTTKDKTPAPGAVRTLGQIAYEAMTVELTRRHGFAYVHPQFNVLHPDDRDSWEIVARAVAEECSNIAEEKGGIQIMGYGGMDEADFAGTNIAAEIRARAGCTIKCQLTQQELIAMFGSHMPMEAVQLLYSAPADMTKDDIMSRLRELADNANEDKSNA